MRFAKWGFLVAGLCGIVIMAPMYLMEERLGRDYPPAITHPEIYYGFVGVTLAWQIMFLVIAYDPVRFRSGMLPAILEKASYVFAILALYFANRAAGIVIGFAVLDAIWMVLFTVAFVRLSKVSM